MFENNFENENRENENFFVKSEEGNFIKERYANDMSEEEERREILRSIINTRKELFNVNRNFDFASNDEVIDYYIYKIKTIQAKLNNLIKIAKEKGIEVNKIA